MRQILIYPNPILRTETPEVREVTATLIKEIEELEKMLIKSENGAGLAATQIGSTGRFFGLKNLNNKKAEMYINPKIVRTWGEKTYPMVVKSKDKSESFLEGCLSFPNYYGTVKRYLKIEVEWKEIRAKNLELRTKILEGFEAIVWQHEADHLDGILFIDHIKRDGGKLYLWEGEEKKQIPISNF
jgi:peptide deformylase